MKTNKLLILGIGNVALKYLEEALAPYNLEPVVMGERNDRPAQTWDSFSPTRFHAVALEAQSIERYLANHSELRQRICAVTTLFDEQWPLVETVALKQGWAYPGHAVVRLSDKSTAATCARALSPPTYPFDACAPERLAAILDSGHGAWIVKPACCSGGEAVGRITGGPSALSQIRVHLARHFALQAQRWLLQPCLEGTLISFEGYMAQAVLHRVGISRRTRIGLTEVANRFPANHCITAQQQALGWEGLQQMFAVAGYRDGWFHCECIVGPSGLHLIDANAGRIGGATVLEQAALAMGVLPHELLAHVLLLPLPQLQRRLPALRPANLETLGVWYGLAETAVLQTLELAPQSARHTRFAKDGAVVPPVGTSDYAWVGMFSGFEADVLTGLNNLRLITDRGPMAPAFSLD